MVDFFLVMIGGVRESLLICNFIDQLMIWCETRAGTTAKYSQPSHIWM